MALSDDVMSGFHVATDPVLIRDSNYDYDDYGNWNYGSVAVGDRVFIMWWTAWYDGDGTPENTAIAGWRIYDVATDGMLTETDSWANYKQTFNGRPDFPLAGVQDNTTANPAGDIRMDKYGGEDRRTLARAFNVIGESPDYHWVGLYYNATDGVSASSLMVFKIRKSDGKLFRQDGTPGFPSASDGDDIVFLSNDGGDGMYLFSPLIGPFRTSEGLVVGSVDAVYATVHELRVKTYLIPFSDTSGITGPPVKTVSVMTDENGLIDPTYGGTHHYATLVDDVIVGVQENRTFGDDIPKDGTLVYTIDANGQFVDIKRVTTDIVSGPPYSAMVPVDGGIVVSGRFSAWNGTDYDDGYMADLPVGIEPNGSITTLAKRNWANSIFTSPINFDTGSAYPPHIVSFNDTGGVGAAGGFGYAGEKDGDPNKYGGYRVVTLGESVHEEVTTQYHTKQVDSVTYPGLPVDTGDTFYPWFLEFPWNIYNSETRSAFGTAIHGRYCYSIVFEVYRTTTDQPGTNNSNVELMYLGLWEVYQEPFRFDGFGTGMKTRRMSFGRA